MLKQTIAFAGAIALAIGLGDAPAAGAAAAKAKKKKPEPPNTAEIFKKLDANSDGKLDAEEFKKLFDFHPKPRAKKGEDAPATDLTAMFKSLDANMDGTLSPDEFKGVTAAVGSGKK